MDDDIRMPFGPPDFTDEDDKIWIETSPETFNHPTKLWTSYWKRFNTIVIPLQSASSYFTDALAAAREAETREELEELLAAKYKERVDELSRAVRAIGDGWRSNLSPHAQDAAFGAGNHPCLETFAELYYSGILAAEKDSKAVEEIPKPQTFDDDDDDARLYSEQEGVSPVHLWDERLEEGRDDFTWTRNIREVGDDEPSVRATPPRRLFRQQWSNQSLDGDSAVGGEDVGNEPKPEDIELPQPLGNGQHVDRVDVGDETNAEDVKGTASRESAESPAAIQFETQLGHAVYQPYKTATAPNAKAAAGSSSGTPSPGPAMHTPESPSTGGGGSAGPSGWARGGREESRAAAAAAAYADMQGVAASGSTASTQCSVGSGKPTSPPASPTVSRRRRSAAGDDGPGANKKRRRSENPANEDRDDGSAGLRLKRQMVGDGRLGGESKQPGKRRVSTA